MPRPRDDARDTARASPSVDSTASLRSFVARLSSPSSRERAAAAESLLELRIGDEGHGAAWALALCASGCVVPPVQNGEFYIFLELRILGKTLSHSWKFYFLSYYI